MSEYWTVSSHYHPTDGSQYASALSRTADDKAQVRALLTSLRETEAIPLANVMAFARDATGRSPDWTPALVPLLSARMAGIVRKHVGESPNVQWLRAQVVSGDGLREQFYVPHFLERPDVLNRDASTWGVNGQPIRWVLSRTKVGGRDFFPSHAFGRNIIVSSKLRGAFLEAGLIGLDMEPARVAD